MTAQNMTENRWEFVITINAHPQQFTVKVKDYGTWFYLAFEEDGERVWELQLKSIEGQPFSLDTEEPQVVYAGTVFIGVPATGCGRLSMTAYNSDGKITASPIGKEAPVDLEAKNAEIVKFNVERNTRIAKENHAWAKKTGLPLQPHHIQ